MCSPWSRKCCSFANKFSPATRASMWHACFAPPRICIALKSSFLARNLELIFRSCSHPPFNLPIPICRMQPQAHFGLSQVAEPARALGRVHDPPHAAQAARRFAQTHRETRHGRKRVLCDSRALSSCRLDGRPALNLHDASAETLFDGLNHFYSIHIHCCSLVHSQGVRVIHAHHRHTAAAMLVTAMPCMSNAAVTGTTRLSSIANGSASATAAAAAPAHDNSCHCVEMRPNSCGRSNVDT
jgi:hypothetical protein